MAAGRPSIQKDIADRLGLARSTVSLALSGRGTIGEATQRQVREAARSLGYRPNASARAVRDGRFGSVGLLLSAIGYRSILPTELLDGILDALASHHLRLTLAKVPDEVLARTGFVPQILREYCCDGLLVNYNAEIPVPLLQHMAASSLPTVWINVRQERDCVHPNDVEAGRMAAQALLEAGHRHVAFANLTGWNHYSSIDRRDGFTETIRAAGGLCDVIDCSVGRGPPATAFAADYLRRKDRATAVVGYTNWDAQPFLAAAREFGWHVPEHLSVATFGSDPLEWTDTPVTTVRLPEHALGEAAVAMLLRRIAHPAAYQPPEAIPCSLFPGVTLAVPPSHAPCPRRRAHTPRSDKS